MQNIQKGLVTILLLLLLAACSQGAEPNIPSATESEKSSGKASTYEVFSAEDDSHKATTKPIAGYTDKELADLPTVKKTVYKIVVPEEFKANQAQPTVEKFIEDMIAGDEDIDEIEVHVFSDESVLTGNYDIAMGIWAPEGKLGKVGGNIAVNNKRDDYETKVTVKKNLQEYLDRRGKFQHNEMDDLTDEDQDDIDHILEDLESQPSSSPATPLR